MPDDPIPVPCRWCGEDHGPRCPWVKALQFSDMNGLITRVEFLTPADCGAPRTAEEVAGDYPKLKPMGG